MVKSNLYTEQVRLLVALLPSVAKQSCFALKGGTADIEHHIPRTAVQASVLKGTGKRFKLLVRQGEISVKIEVTPVLRGSVFPAEARHLTARAAEAFGFARMTVLGFADLYAGKICAALDRQHPRDLYDVYWLLRQEGLDEKLKNAFLVYLMGHNRPMAELLAPQVQDIAAQYQAELAGMVDVQVELDPLRKTLPELVRVIHTAMTEGDKRFLLALKRGDQDWGDFALPEVARLPAIQWKMFNLARMQPVKRRQAANKLETILFG
ncbi:MAG: nucleotidyl transferase AbiEii/AbiGii toxin family protein [Desulfobacterales bacterium]|nr:nucleotidyl transferase AbiEii/AbiGii toxin family protein [Desulfobacterales bacterium]